MVNNYYCAADICDKTSAVCSLTLHCDDFASSRTLTLCLALALDLVTGVHVFLMALTLNSKE